MRLAQWPIRRLLVLWFALGMCYALLWVRARLIDARIERQSGLAVPHIGVEDRERVAPDSSPALQGLNAAQRDTLLRALKPIATTRAPALTKAGAAASRVVLLILIALLLPAFVLLAITCTWFVMRLGSKRESASAAA